MDEPAAMLDFSLGASDYRQGADTTIYINFQTLHDIPVGGYVSIEFNEIELDFIDEETFDCATQVQRNPDCIVFRGEAILIKNIFGSRFVAGNSLNITLFNMRIDVYKEGLSDEVVVRTHTSDGYLIDWIEDGLKFEFDCNFPCLTC